MSSFAFLYNSFDREKKNQHKYSFLHFLWYLYKPLSKSFRGTTKKRENKPFTYILTVGLGSGR